MKWTFKNWSLIGHWALGLGHFIRSRTLTAFLLAIVVSFAPVLPSFQPLVLIGAPEGVAAEIVWDGEAGDGRWSNPVNWHGDVLPSEQDVAVFDGQQSVPAVIDVNAAIGGIELGQQFVGQLEMLTGVSLAVGHDGFRQRSGRFKASEGEITVHGSLQLWGGEFVAPADTLRLRGNISVLQDGAFKHNAGTVILEGTEQLIFGSVEFNNLVKTGSISRRLSFDPTAKIVVAGELTLAGAPATSNEVVDANFLRVASTEAGKPATIALGGTATAEHIRVRDVELTGSDTVTCQNCFGSGSVAGWEFQKPLDGEGFAGIVPVPRPAPIPPGVLQHEGGEDNLVHFAADEPIAFVLSASEEGEDLRLAPIEDSTIVAAVKERAQHELGGQDPATVTPTDLSQPEESGLKLLSRLWRVPKKLLNVAVAWAQGVPRAGLEAEVVHPTGQFSFIEPVIEEVEGQVVLRSKTSGEPFRPGRYAMRVSQGNQKVEHDFIHGVLLFNVTHEQPEVGDTAAFHLGVLDDTGHTVCDADVVVVVLDPSGGVTELETARSSHCGPRSHSEEPDYSTQYQFDEPGEYTLSMRATYAPNPLAHETTTRTLSRKIHVETDRDLSIVRTAPTRIYPAEPYQVQLEVRAEQGWQGSIIEALPDGFTAHTISHGGAQHVGGGVGGPTEPVPDITPQELEEIAETEEVDAVVAPGGTVAGDTDQAAAEIPSPTPTLLPTVSPTPTPSSVPELIPSPLPSPFFSPSPVVSPEPTQQPEPSPIPDGEPTLAQPAVIAGAATVVWPDVSLQAGETATLSYSFDAPQFGPQVYTADAATAVGSSGVHTGDSDWHVAVDGVVSGQLVVKEGEADGPADFKPGDILQAYAPEYVLKIHAEYLTGLDFTGFNEQRLREPGSLLEAYLENVKTSRFDRIGVTAVRRTNLATGETTVITETPNADGEAMDVPLFIARRLKNDQHLLFGEPGKEYWFGGKDRVTPENLEKIWDRIEEQTEYRREYFDTHALTPVEKQKLRLVPVAGLTNEIAGELTSGTDEEQAKEATTTVSKHIVPLDALKDVPPAQRSAIQSVTRERPHEASPESISGSVHSLVATVRGLYTTTTQLPRRLATRLLPQTLAAGTVTTSIGTRSAENVDITGVSGSGPYTVTLSGATSSTDNGDTLTDEAATPNSYLITAGAGTASLTVTDSFGAGVAPSSAASSQATTTRTYATVTSWEASLDDTNLYTSSDDAVGEVHNDGTITETSTVTINGGGTVGLSSRTVTVPSGERHDGTAGTGSDINRSTGVGAIISTGIDNTSIAWLEMTESSSGNMGGGIGISGGDDGIYARNTIVHNIDRGNSSDVQGIQTSGTGTTAAALNNIVYDIENTSSGDAEGITYDGGGPTGDNGIINNTIYNIETNSGTAVGMNFTRDDADMEAKNNIAVGTTTSSGSATDFTWAGTTNIDTDYNMSSDASADDDGGSNSVISVTVGDQFVSTTADSEDLHLKAGSDAIDEGVDKATTPTNVNFDIDNRNRDSEGDTWDIGADELVAASTRRILHIVQ